VNTVGIDLSLTSPSICVHKGNEFSINNCKIHYLTSVKKSAIQNDIIHGSLWPEYSCDEERYGIVSKWALDILQAQEINEVYIEGYAFNAVGRVFQIAENTGILKYKIWQTGTTCITVPPTVIKKFATGKGNANKESLNDFFEKETCLNLKDTLKLTSKQWNPSSDIIDSYFVCKYGVSNGKKI
jgi:Holliday junction resolvasome RuvABC endonuclease subunit